MNEIGVLVWVVLLTIGVGSSIASTVRKARGLRAPAANPPGPPGRSPAASPASQANVRRFVVTQAGPAPRAPQPPTRAPAPVRRPEPAPAAEMQPWPTERRAAGLRRLFPGRNDLVRAVVAAEVLGSPRGLGDEPFRR